MTSEADASECFVYVTLPGATTPVVAGRFVREVDRHGVAIGRFIYGKSYLARPDAVEIDPIELPLGQGVRETTRLNGIFGALRDAGPDHWGRRVIERHAHKAQLGELDYLLHSPDDWAGALGFGLGPEPPAPRRDFNQTLDLEKLQSLADVLIEDEESVVDDDVIQVEELLLLGTSMGGARPKAVVEDAEGLWIAKFNRSDDRWNNARVEHAMLTLARQAGINAAPSRVIQVAGRDVLLVRRFDRERTEDGYRRARMVSALTLLGAEDTYRSRERWSYVFLVEELRRVSATPRQDGAELFRRMTFNALISNTDDHPRNHAIVAPEQTWRLSPAYDLTPAPVSGEQRELAMACGDLGRSAHAQNLLTQASRFLLETEQARAIVDQMEAAIRSSWHPTCREAGVSERDCGLIQPAFDYPGFRAPVSGSDSAGPV